MMIIKRKKIIESFTDLNKIIKLCEDFKIEKNNNSWQSILNFTLKELNFDAQEITQCSTN